MEPKRDKGEKKNKMHYLVINITNSSSNLLPAHLKLRENNGEIIPSLRINQCDGLGFVVLLGLIQIRDGLGLRGREQTLDFFGGDCFIRNLNVMKIIEEWKGDQRTKKWGREKKRKEKKRKEKKRKEKKRKEKKRNKEKKK